MSSSRQTSALPLGPPRCSLRLIASNTKLFLDFRPNFFLPFERALLLRSHPSPPTLPLPLPCPLSPWNLPFYFSLSSNYFSFLLFLSFSSPPLSSSSPGFLPPSLPLSPGERLLTATNEGMKDVILSTNDHVTEFKALSKQLQSLVREVKKTAEYFLVRPLPSLPSFSLFSPVLFNYTFPTLLSIH